MALSLASLLTPSTEDESLALCLDILASLGFNTTSWQSGSRQRTLVQLLARVHSNLTTTVSQIAAGGYNGLATGGFLTLLSESFFQNFRVEAKVTEGIFALASSPTAPPHTIAIGDLQIATTPTQEATTQTFRNVTGDTLNTGGAITLEFEAEVAGAAGNIPNNTTLYMWTPLVGVTVTNPPAGAAGTWITDPGLDEESDPRLTTRNNDRWGTTSYGSSDGAYRFWAMTAEPTVTRVKVRSDNPFGPGTVDVVCATASGGITGLQATTIREYIYGIPDGVGRRPINDIVSVQTAIAVAPVMAFTAKVRTQFQTTNALLIQETIQEYLGEIDIGGTIVPPASTGVVVMSEIIERVMALPGMINFQPSNPVDVPLGPLDIVTTTPAITVNYV